MYRSLSKHLASNVSDSDLSSRAYLSIMFIRCVASSEKSMF